MFQLYCSGKFFWGRNPSTRSKPWPVENHWQTLLHNVVLSTPHHEQDSNSPLVVISIDCIGSCKSNYHTFMTTTAPISKVGLKPIKISLLCSTFYMLSYLYILYMYCHLTSNYEEGRVGIQLTGLTLPLFLCLSKARTWIPMSCIVYYGLFLYVPWVRARGDFSFC